MPRHLEKQYLLNKIKFIFHLTIFVFILVMGGILFSAHNCYAQSVITIEVMGSGEIVESEMEKARELAISNSLTEAVNQVANGLIPQEGMVQFFTELSQTVFNDVQSYIQSYKVVDEWISENEYHVMVEAIVSEDSVKQSLADAGVIRSRKKLPRILFLISEQKVHDAIPIYWWDITDRTVLPVTEMTLAKQMKELGFSITRHADIPIPSQWIGLRQTPDLSDKQALKLGNNSSAQILVIGSAQVQIARFIQLRGKELKGILNLRAIRVDNGQQIAQSYQTTTIVENEPSTGNQEVLSTLATLAGEELSNQLMEIWPKIAQNPTQITLVVHGTQNLPVFVRFRKTLATLSDVSAIMLTELKPNQSSLRIDYKGDARTLAQAMVENIYDGFWVNISEVNHNIIQVQLKQ